MKLPAGSFVAEYAKTGRAACKKCKNNIGQGSVRLGKMVQSSFFDGCQAMWHHVDCALKTQAAQTLTSADDIHGFCDLRWEDQQKLRDKLAKIVTSSADSTLAGRAEGLQVQYAKSGKSMCRGCEQYIENKAIRLAFLLDSGGPYGPAAAWHHVDCFLEHHPEKARDIKDFAGWTNLTADDQKALGQRMRDNAASLAKSENVVTSSTEGAQPSESAGPKRATRKRGRAQSDAEAALRTQNQKWWKVKDALSTIVADMNNKAKKDLFDSILAHNSISLDKYDKEPIDVLTDSLVFGVTDVCSDCNTSRLVWQSSSMQYACPAQLTWGKCPGTKVSHKVQVSQMSFPTSLDEPALKSLLAKPTTRILTQQLGTVSKVGMMTSEELEIKLQRKRQESKADESGQAASNEPVKEEEKRRKVTLKGRAEVDAASELDVTHHVLEFGDDVYSATLSASDVGANRNSYYRLQILEGDWVTDASDAAKKKKSGAGSANYYFFRSWGRVGTTIGGSTLTRCDSRDAAIDLFRIVYYEKTQNQFGAVQFVKQPRMYFPLEVEMPAADMMEKSTIAPGSRTKLPTQVQSILQMIFDVEAMRRVMLEMDLDLKKMPLGNLSKAQLKRAYNLLSEAQGLLLSSEGTASKGKIVETTNQFFTLIPHDFGRARPPLLDNEKIIKAKLDMLETLMELEIATNLLNSEMAEDQLAMDPLDKHYNSLKIDLTPIAHDSAIFAAINNSVQTTHAATHTQYSLQLVNVFKVSRHGEAKSFRDYVSQTRDLMENRKILWHGSRTTNFAGILSQGLRIAPPEAPVTGYMFGKGVYFADLVSKSANYCCTTQRDPDGLLLLSEVALGSVHELTGSQYIEQLPSGKHSVKGCGKTVPSNVTPLPSVISVPKPSGTESRMETSTTTVVESIATASTTGRITRSRAKATKVVQTVQTSPDDELEASFVDLSLGPTKKALHERSELLYNEFIVYDTRQICLRYLVHVKFVYK